MKQTTTVYELRVSVVVPNVGDKPEYSEAEIVSRVDAALRYVPGGCTVEPLALWHIGPQSIDVWPVTLSALFRRPKQ